MVLIIVWIPVLCQQYSYCGSFYNQSCKFWIIPNLRRANDDLEVYLFHTGFCSSSYGSTANATTQCFDWYFTISGKLSRDKANNYWLSSDTCDWVCSHLIHFFIYKWNPQLVSALLVPKTMLLTSYQFWLRFIMTSASVGAIVSSTDEYANKVKSTA